MKIAVVDDSAILRAALRNTLTGLGHEVICEADGSESLFSCLQKGVMPDVILLDVFFPTENGLDILQAVKQYRKEIKVVVITGMNQQAITQEAQERGADDIIYKPFGTEDLAQTLEKLKTV